MSSLMTRKAWDVNAEEWSHRTRSGTDLSRKHILIPEFIHLISEVGGNDLLDAGSGAADFGSILHHRYHIRVIGVDSSIEMCRQAATRPSMANRLICGDLSRLPFTAHSFDTIVANMVLGSVKDLQCCCAEFARVLRPSGILIFSILHPARVVPVDVPKLVDIEKGIEAAASIVEVEDYFHERRIEARLKLGGSGWLPRSVEYYHRPLSIYSAALSCNGLVTLGLREPLPAQSVLDKYPTMAPFWRMAPFLVWIARKDPSRT